MLSKEEHRAFTTAFWGHFRIEMRKERSSNGRRMNWLNYPTEINDVYLRMEVNKTGAYLHFDIQFKDEGVRSIFWEQLEELRTVLEAEMGNDGLWFQHLELPNLPPRSRVSWGKEGLSLYKTEDHHAIYAFLKERLLAFDRFYQEFKDILVLLVQ